MSVFRKIRSRNSVVGKDEFQLGDCEVQKVRIYYRNAQSHRILPVYVRHGLTWRLKTTISWLCLEYGSPYCNFGPSGTGRSEIIVRQHCNTHNLN